MKRCNSLRHAESGLRWRAILSVAVAATSLLGVTAQSAAADSNESLGSKLLDDLAPTAPAPARDQANASARPQTSAPVPETAAPSMVPLAQVRQGMQSAELLLEQTHLTNETGTAKLAGIAQTKVITQLDELIAQLSKQCNCQGGQCDKPSSADKPGPPKPGSKMAKSAGKAPARDSSDRLGRTSAKPVDKAELNDTLKHLWGHLPERERQQMLQSFSDEFLPKYQQEIEQYYRRLSEEKDSAGTPTGAK